MDKTCAVGGLKIVILSAQAEHPVCGICTGMGVGEGQPGVIKLIAFQFVAILNLRN